MSFKLRAKVTKVRFAAFSISSMHMNITSTLRRTSRPIAPIVNSTAASVRYQEAPMLTALDLRIGDPGTGIGIGIGRPVPPDASAPPAAPPSGPSVTSPVSTPASSGSPASPAGRRGARARPRRRPR